MKHQIPAVTDAVAPSTEYLGIDKGFEIGIRLAPSRQIVHSMSGALSVFLADNPHTPVRLVGLDTYVSRVHITIAITLGSLEDIKVAGPQSCAAIDFLYELLIKFEAFDPCVVELPDPYSVEAKCANGLDLNDLIEAQSARVRSQLLVGS